MDKRKDGGVQGSGAKVLPDDEVCACLSDTGERKVRLYERCQRCGAFMEADYLAEELEARARQAEYPIFREQNDYLKLEVERDLAEARADRYRGALERLLAAVESRQGGSSQDWWAAKDAARAALRNQETDE